MKNKKDKKKVKQEKIIVEEKASTANPVQSRREFLNKLWKGLGVVAVIEFAAVFFGFLFSNKSEDENQKLANYGKTFGILSLTVEEIADILDPIEFESRMRNECPPLPFLYAISSLTVRNEILQLFPKHEFSRTNLEKAAKIALASSEVKKLSKRMEQRVFAQINELSFIKDGKIREELAALFFAQVSLLKHSLQ